MYGQKPVLGMSSRDEQLYTFGPTRDFKRTRRELKFQIYKLCESQLWNSNCANSKIFMYNVVIFCDLFRPLKRTFRIKSKVLGKLLGLDYLE